MLGSVKHAVLLCACKYGRARQELTGGWTAVCMRLPGAFALTCLCQWSASSTSLLRFLWSELKRFYSCQKRSVAASQAGQPARPISIHLPWFYRFVMQGPYSPIFNRFCLCLGAVWIEYSLPPWQQLFNLEMKSATSAIKFFFLPFERVVNLCVLTYVSRSRWSSEYCIFFFRILSSCFTIGGMGFHKLWVPSRDLSRFRWRASYNLCAAWFRFFFQFVILYLYIFSFLLYSTLQ